MDWSAEFYRTASWQLFIVGAACLYVGSTATLGSGLQQVLIMLFALSVPAQTWILVSWFKLARLRDEVELLRCRKEGRE